MNVDPVTALVFGIIGAIVGAAINHYFTSRRSDKEFSREVRLASLEDTRLFYIAYLDWVRRCALHGASRKGRPTAAAHPKADLDLIGNHWLSHELRDLEAEFVVPGRRPGLTKDETARFDRAGNEVMDAFRKNEERILRGQKPKLVKHIRSEYAADPVTEWSRRRERRRIVHGDHLDAFAKDHAERADEARRTATRDRLIGESVTEPIADAWIAAWEAQAVRDGLERGERYWRSAWVWISAQRKHRVRP